jgi:tetratricopeptide (TPR) repeat protein
MLKGRFHSKHEVHFRRKWAVQALFLLAFCALTASLAPLVITKFWRSKIDRKELLRLWESSSFKTAYIESGEQLVQKPLDFFLLTLHGFSAYQLAVAQINNSGVIAYIDDCIWSLRKALLSKEGMNDGRIFYVLGKAYYDKGRGYADLAVHYLEKAREAGFAARDIPQYLGLAYGTMGDYRNSVEAFSLVLNEEASAGPSASPSDILLLSTAKAYRALEENDQAGAYLIRCLDVSRDSRTVVAARLLLGEIMAEQDDPAGAEAEFFKVIEEGGENAEARYQLGELYAAGGDPVRARAEWRKAVNIDPAHQLSRMRLNL